jgi:hypothetical protein
MNASQDVQDTDIEGEKTVRKRRMEDRVKEMKNKRE